MGELVHPEEQQLLSILLAPLDSQAATMSEHVERHNDSGRVPSKIDPPVGVLDEHEDHCQGSGPKLCVAFVGMGSQHPTMGRQLAERYPSFLASIKENDRILTEVYGQPSLLDRTGLFVPGGECSLNPSGTWPLNDVILSFAYVQISLWDLIRSLGFSADFAIGTSIGEIAMGYAAGHYDRTTTIGIAAAFATAMSEVEGNGATIFVAVSPRQARLIIDDVLLQAGVTSGLWISSFHSPHAVAIAGTHPLINALFAFLSNSKAFSNTFAVRLPQLGCAFHTPLMEPIEAPLRAALGNLDLGQISNTGTPDVRVMSTIDGTWLNRPLDCDYFWDNVLRPTKFGNIVQKLVHDEGENIVILEIAAHPAMKTCVEQCGARYVGLIRRPAPDTLVDDSNECVQLLEAVQHLYEAGFRSELPLGVFEQALRLLRAGK
ncbi:acyl transferase/acyl hydrolase/lysophospholipase [Suillus clintonianus]|uniref:acyl transferase/acyl hydrolase/lysophospholipase n=1 Tax=Suillus clintonianus TaxID=1904413 RepID=UPI001B876E43|nr:acyl transferase/acyl hydrolase/lysophospholipase [Suillus clintonianus]KAG2148763.1 acyl transferase/acyl hydrolase/lysophospholipase [Suillus clintonianus]